MSDSQADKAESHQPSERDFHFSSEPSLEELRKAQTDFIRDRDWGQFHTPRNLFMALVGEVGELAELFQWKNDQGGDDATKWPEKERTRLEEEISDVFIYLLALADKCKVDLPQAVVNKMQLNRKKYPIEKAYGRAKKYTDL